jgi:cytochrome c2
MKQQVLFYFFSVFFTVSVLAQDGATLFRQNCAACHQIGRGRLVGPDLLNIHERRNDEWVHQFIRSSQTLIKAGDPEAVQLFEEYNKLVMPDNTHLSDEDINAIMAYIRSGGGDTGTTEVTPAASRPPQRISTPQNQRTVTQERLEQVRKIETAEERSTRLTSMFFRHVVITLLSLSILFTILILFVLKNNRPG